MKLSLCCLHQYYIFISSIISNVHSTASHFEIDILMQRCFFFLKVAYLILLPWNAIAKTMDALDFLCLCFHSSGSMTFSHTNACVFCVRSRNPPSSFITDPKWICCSWTKTLGCFGQWLRTVLRAIYAETINAHTKQTPVNTDTSQQTTKPAQPLRHWRLLGTTAFLCLFVRYMS